jgi:hypothetical protein
MASHTNIPHYEIDLPNPKTQTYENPTSQDLENLGIDTKTIPYTISNEEVNAFKCITWDCTRKINALRVAPFLPQ